MATEASGVKRSIIGELPTREIPLDFLKKITNQFSDECIIGSGAFGKVYKGVVEETSEVVAVKRLSESSPVSRDTAFKNEVLNIMALNHENIVKLVGYCHESQKKVVQNNGRYVVADIVECLLCYEYLPKGSVHKNLFEIPGYMNWETRFKIIKGICQGLCFLHKIPIVHMDLKPENILLDDNMVPKIADFGLSRLFGQDQTRQRTQNVVGSYGYIAPEYLYRGEISTQSDIYSLGLMIIEITTGEKHIPERNEPSARKFLDKVREKWTPEYIVSNSLYASLGAEYLEQVKACIEIGLECVHPERKKRPSIDVIADKLNGK
ncbi:hypothetical protein EJB05_28389 [Eragrostis curvula]|uniref:Protein kinase domain-containing protein n=1 Tax=Eragrostis curvula TaxID=38414 RepID=A0A5J9UR67_9POAL|nr:hypothetical protein EJB05_28389 [Eragrostis curvula]